jgi:FtsZ-binding cell division protein ZapB
MKSDPGLLLLASLGASLLAAGGAFLHAAFVSGLKGRGGGHPGGQEGDPLQRLARAEAELGVLREELVQSNATKEAQRIEMVEQRQRSERHVQSAQAEIQRLAAEGELEKNRTKAAEDDAKEVRTKLAAAEQELKRGRGNSGDPKVITSLQGEVGELQKKLKAASEERDAARAKVEALERLVEGVRARSRALAEELKVLKGEEGN